ncbi:MAG: 2-phospho-L-lactate transferase [Actinomycetota bacterium]|nr:2-phospho-L-lactate transferase [Actinomycetota bacterium]
MKIVELSGGVGGARMARGFAGLSDVDLTVVVNVGDDADNHGLAVSPDLDTVVYTLAGMEGPLGWGRAGDTFHTNDELARFGVDNTFRIGDRDLALKLYRTQCMHEGRSLSEATSDIVESFGIASAITPATDDLLRTEVRIDRDGWISFQEYFVKRQAQPEVLELRFAGAIEASPAPGVVEALAAADVVVIAPSNPPLSIWPILDIPRIRETVASHPRVIAVSPLIGGKTVKGPADRVMASLGLPPGNEGVATAYEGLIDTIVIDTHDAADMETLAGLNVLVTDTLIKEGTHAERLARELVAR